MLTSFINRDNVILKLIHLRCKYADKRADVLQQNLLFDRSNDAKENADEDNVSRDERFIYSLFPPRSKWCGLNKRRDKDDSIKRNVRKLTYTYKKAKKNQCTESWYNNLCSYADSIVSMIFNAEESIPKPFVFVLEKKRVDNYIICRPVCTFPLKIKVALSLINKALTTLLDPYFFNCSFAFRLPNNDRLTLQHLNAVLEIQRYRKDHLKKPLYVAECDMQKFYDTIDHRVIKKKFNVLLRKLKTDNKIKHNEFVCLKRWFYNYVDCFDFYRDVYSLNKLNYNDTVWRLVKNKKDCICRIEWINKFLHNEKLIKSQRNKPKGVPQGGALSGLIANILMHFVDLNVLDEMADDDIKYLRFCDDMILIGADKNKVNNVFRRYENSVKALMLFPHDKVDIHLNKMAEFWNGKSRGPYEWNESGKNVYPWITFVGFDCNWQGCLRIRKSSLKKQIKKQYEVIEKVLYNSDLYTNRPKYCMNTILSSITHQLIGMSVGRVDLRNYINNDNLHSWMSAFSILDKNKWSESQLKLLDRHRAKMIHRASKKLSMLKCPAFKISNNKHVSYLGKAFSYYGQCFDYKVDIDKKENL